MNLCFDLSAPFVDSSKLKRDDERIHEKAQKQDTVNLEDDG